MMTHAQRKGYAGSMQGHRLKVTIIFCMEPVVIPVEGDRCHGLEAERMGPDASWCLSVLVG